MYTQDIVNKIQKKESFILANDGTYLGKLSLNSFHRESVFNQFGRYGSEFSSVSIFNQFGRYGSEFSSLSPYNEFTRTPPKIYLRGREIGLLTKNQFLGFRNVDPDRLREWMVNQNLNY